MSTLTKVLIILLTIASIFLCGIVVTYVANAVDYKQKYDGLDNEYQAAKKSEENANRQFNELKNKTDEEKLKLGSDIAALKVEIGRLEAELKQVIIVRDDAQRKVNNWATIVQDYKASNDEQRKMLANAIAERDRKDTELIKQGKELKDTTDALIERMAVIAQLEEKSKRLLEEKTGLQNKLDEFLRQYGKVIAPPEPVTTAKEKVRVAPPAQDIGLKGLITQVDLKKLLAEISIGSAHGVKEGMRFHTTRGDKFICDIVILDVEPESAIGWLELLQESPQDQPRAGDNVSTNL